METLYNPDISTADKKRFVARLRQDLAQISRTRKGTPTEEDVDNIIKPIVDGLVPAILYDDRVVHEVRCRKLDLRDLPDGSASQPVKLMSRMLLGGDFVLVRVTGVQPRMDFYDV